MGLFSKHPCVYCNESVGFIKGKKLADGNYICKDCEKNCSSFIEVSRYSKPFLDAHKEYMEKQDLLYKREFEPLGKDGTFRYVRDFNGIVFADSIGMFEIVSSKAEKKNYKELFRYDQLQDFRYYTEPNNNSQSQKAYSEAGIELIFRCPVDTNGISLGTNYENQFHPYVSVIRIPFEKDTDSQTAGSVAKNHLNELFGRESETVSGSIKQAFTGTGQERAQIKAAAETAKSLGNLLKASVKDGVQAGLEATKDDLIGAATGLFNATLNYGAMYTERADEAERRAWSQ